MHCRSNVRQLANHYQEIVSLKAEVVIVAPGQPADAVRLSEKLDLPFPVLADPTGMTTGAYGVPRSLFGLIQRSGSFLIDRSGIVRYARTGINPAQSFVKTELLGALRDLDRQVGA